MKQVWEQEPKKIIQVVQKEKEELQQDILLLKLHRW